jgi:sec-independent protein translocase protein TatA
MPSLGAPELIIILVIVLLVFGAGKLPEIGSALGKGVKEFKAASKELKEAQEDVMEATELEPKAKRDDEAAKQA